MVVKFNEMRLKSQRFITVGTLLTNREIFELLDADENYLYDKDDNQLTSH